MNLLAPPADDAPCGLIAGAGRYPIVLAQALRQQGKRIICLGIKDHPDPILESLCDSYAELGLGKLGGAIRYFQRRGVATATMAGKLHKVLLMQGHWVNLVPDWRAFWTFFPHFLTLSQDRKDDTLLGAVVESFARQGITFVPATLFAPELLVKTGTLTKRLPTRAELKDIQFGWEIAKQIGRIDIGQSVAVKGRAVLAVEAVEGTDACIRRAGELCKASGFTVVKVAKPQQDMRFDVPTIGMGTMESLVQSGARVLAVEAEKTILIDQPDVIAFANQHQLTIVAFRDVAANELIDAA